MTLPSDYASLTGTIRVLERHLLGPTDVTRMVEAPDTDTAFHVFNDLDYAGELLDLKATEYAKALDNKLARVKRVFERSIPDQKLVTYLFQLRDFHNFKSLFKQKLFATAAETPLSSIGILPLAQVKSAILEEQVNALPEPYRTLITEAHAQFEKEASPEAVDTYFERHYFIQQLRVAQELKNPYLQKLVEVRAGIANIKIFLRAKRLKRSATFLKEHVVTDGRIAPELLLSYYKDETLDRFVAEIKRQFDKLVGEAVERYIQNGSLWKLERDLENAELAFVRAGKYITYGPEVAVSYYYAKRNAIRNIRLIMTGKFEGLAPKEIRERLREHY